MQTRNSITRENLLRGDERRPRSERLHIADGCEDPMGASDLGDLRLHMRGVQCTDRKGVHPLQQPSLAALTDVFEQAPCRSFARDADEEQRRQTVARHTILCAELVQTQRSGDLIQIDRRERRAPHRLEHHRRIHALHTCRSDARALRDALGERRQ